MCVTRMIVFSCNLCLLRRTCKAWKIFVAFTSDCQNKTWMYFGNAARSLHRPPTHPNQLRPSFHHTVKSTSGQAWKRFTRPVVMTTSNLPTHSALTCSSILLGTQGLSMCCRRQLTTPPGNKDNRYYEKENIFTIPNLLSMSRIVLSPFLGYLVLSEKYMLAFGLFALAGVSDMVDGYIARRFPGQSSMLGSVLDPLADKCLASVLFITLTVMGLIPVPLTVLILARDGVLVGGSFYLRYATLPPPRTWSRYWDIQRATVEVTPSTLSKVNTLLQLLLVGLSLGAPVVDMVGHPSLQALWYVTGFTTVASGLTYMVHFGGFKVLKKKHRASSKRELP